MSNLQFTLDDYIIYIFASHKKRLLVEGSDDYRLFCRLFDLFTEKGASIDIDDASCLIGFETAIGNREKVELVCSTLRGKDFSNKFVGFVDRDYRGFLGRHNFKTI